MNSQCFWSCNLFHLFFPITFSYLNINLDSNYSTCKFFIRYKIKCNIKQGPFLFSFFSILVVNKQITIKYIFTNGITFSHMIKNCKYIFWFKSGQLQEPTGRTNIYTHTHRHIPSCIPGTITIMKTKCYRFSM